MTRQDADRAHAAALRITKFAQAEGIGRTSTPERRDFDHLIARKPVAQRTEAEKTAAALDRMRGLPGVSRDSAAGFASRDQEPSS